MDLTGIHHVTAITKNAEQNHIFYTEVLGMRLVKKTVDPDDPSVYHLFYADEMGRPGTDISFFEVPKATMKHEGTSNISQISFRVPNDKALVYWQDRFKELKVDHDKIVEQADRKVIHFRDPEKQRLALVSDETNEGIEGGIPWEHSPVPVEHGIIGLGPVTLTLANPSTTITILTRLLTFEQVSSYPSPIEDQDDILIFSTGEGGSGAEIHIETRTDLLPIEPGQASVHHVSLRVTTDEELRSWKDFLDKAQMPNSGLVDRLYFRSVYFRDPNGILFEIATDGPGFTIDEEADSLGEKLSLPPDLERRRKDIEKDLAPFITTK